jgi:DNA replication protein DnaC
MEFEEFWREYPRKVGRWKAEKNWWKLHENERVACIEGLRLWKQTAQWQSAGGMFIPYASTFLAQRRWEDEPWTGAFAEKHA